MASQLPSGSGTSSDSGSGGSGGSRNSHQLLIASILAIEADTTLSEVEKARKRQQLFTGEPRKPAHVNVPRFTPCLCTMNGPESEAAAADLDENRDMCLACFMKLRINRN